MNKSIHWTTNTIFHTNPKGRKKNPVFYLCQSIIVNIIKASTYSVQNKQGRTHIIRSNQASIAALKCPSGSSPKFISWNISTKNSGMLYTPITGSWPMAKHTAAVFLCPQALRYTNKPPSTPHCRTFFLKWQRTKGKLKSLYKFDTRSK